MRRSALNILAGVTAAIAAAAIVLHVFGVPATALGVAAFGVPAALIVISLAEARRIRGLAFWAPVGAGLGAIGYAALKQAHTFENWNALLALMASGAFAGLVYWAIAGKRSGTLAAAIDAAGQNAALDENKFGQRCWVCTALLLLVGVAPLALMIAYIARPDATWPQTITETAQADGIQQLTNASLPWVKLKITDHVGHVTGIAPDENARALAFAKANALLAPLIGRPGVIAYLQNDITIIQQTGPTVAEQVLAAVKQQRIAAEAKRKTSKKSAKDRAREERRAAEAKRKADQYAAKARAAEEMRVAEEKRIAAAEAKRKADEDAAVAAAAAKTRALEEERLAADAQRKAEDAKRLALEAEREKSAVAAARQAEADQADADRSQKAQSAPPPPPVSNCDADFAELFKSTSIQFASRATSLDAKLNAFLESTTALSKRCPDYAIDIAGHADRTGSEAKNLATSLARALAVRDALTSRGIANDRLTVTGYGDARPLNPARNRTAFASNRRVELSAHRVNTSPAPAAETKVLTRPDVKPFKPGECHTRLTRAVEEANIHFAVNSAHLRQRATRSIRDVARVLRRCPSHALAVNGHADRRGTAEANQSLSDARAKAVREALIARGVQPDRLTAVGHGALMPKANGASRQDFARNRRVDFDVSATAPPDSR